MLIDWFTVVAQIVNFLVLVALLKHFLWGKLSRAIDEREARVAGELVKAEEKNKEAERQAEHLRLQALEQERARDELLLQACKDAQEQRATLVEEARHSVREMEQRWHEDLDRERRAFFGELRARTTSEILAIIRRALADLSSSDLQQATVQVFLYKLNSLDNAVVNKLGTKGQVVRSAMELPPETRKEIQVILKARLGACPELTFEKDPTMAWGIELRGNGQKIGWTPDTYLDSLEENLKHALEHQIEVVDREVVPAKVG